jgi:hypothetical protein
MPMQSASAKSSISVKTQSLDSKLCRTIGGTWQGTKSPSCKIEGVVPLTTDLSIPKGVALIVSSGSTLNNNAIIDNLGGSISNFGTINNARVLVNDLGVVNNYFGSNLNNFAEIDNFADFNNFSGSTIRNYGTAIFTVNGPGKFNNASNATFDNLGGAILYSASASNNGTIRNLAGSYIAVNANFVNNGEIVNGGQSIFDNTSTFYNSGKFLNISEGDFFNSGTFTSTYNSGNGIENAGTIRIDLVVNLFFKLH